MIKITPETLAEPEGLDLTMTEADDLGFCRYAPTPKLWQCLKASIAPLTPAKAGIQRKTL
jgi:hypothetical protein